MGVSGFVACSHPPSLADGLWRAHACQAPCEMGQTQPWPPRAHSLTGKMRGGGQAKQAWSGDVGAPGGPEEMPDPAWGLGGSGARKGRRQPEPVLCPARVLSLPPSDPERLSHCPRLHSQKVARQTANPGPCISQGVPSAPLLSCPVRGSQPGRSQAEQRELFVPQPTGRVVCQARGELGVGCWNRGWSSSQPPGQDPEPWGSGS